MQYRGWTTATQRPDSPPPRVDNLPITVDNRMRVWRNGAPGRDPSGPAGVIAGAVTRSLTPRLRPSTGPSPIRRETSTAEGDYSTSLPSVAVRQTHILHTITTMMTR